MSRFSKVKCKEGHRRHFDYIQSFPDSIISAHNIFPEKFEIEQHWF